MKFIKIETDEMAKILLNKMTVDMSIDFEQTKECAINAVDIILNYTLNEFQWSDKQVSPSLLADREYWREVKQILENK
jgi:hypothetical protein